MPIFANLWAMANKSLTSVPIKILKVALALLLAVQISWPGEAVGAARWIWPVANPVLIKSFNPPPKPWLAGHRGIDLAARVGDSVMAAGSGFVTFAGPLADKGVVVISHGPIRTTYEPVKATVSVGDYVQVADTIGHLQSGASHCSKSLQVTCLHWGLRRGDHYLNSILLLNPRIRLKPIPRK